MVEVIEHQISLHARGDRAGAIAQIYPLGSAHGGHLHRLLGRQPVVVVLIGDRVQNGAQLDRLQQILGVVAGGTVAAKGDIEARLAAFQNGG